MNAIKLGVGILFVVLAAKACTLAMAQDVEQASDTSVTQADPPEHHITVSETQGENARRVRPDDRLQSASNAIVSVSAPTATAADQQPSTAPSSTKWQDDGLDGGRSSYNDPCPSVYGQVEALFLMREPRFTQQAIVDNKDTNTTLLSTSDLDFNFEPGVRATVGMRLCEGRALEFSYFGLWQGDASAVAEAPNLIFPGGETGGNVFPWMNRVQVNYSSWMHSFELNSPCCCGCCDQCDSGKGGDKSDSGKGRDEGGCGDVRCRSFEWFGGFRYLNLGEELNIAAQGAEPGDQGTYNIRTANHLYGGQLGARLRRSRGLFGWEATGKAGIFGNDAQQTQLVEDYLYTIRPTVSSRGGQVAFVGEINLSALCRLTDVWNLRAGYNAMWIEGLALAPDQLDFNFATAPSGNQLHNGGGMFLHGVNAGLEARW